MQQKVFLGLDDGHFLTEQRGEMAQISHSNNSLPHTDRAQPLMLLHTDTFLLLQLTSSSYKTVTELFFAEGVFPKLCQAPLISPIQQKVCPFPFLFFIGYDQLALFPHPNPECILTKELGNHIPSSGY